MNYNSVGVLFVLFGWISMALDETVPVTGSSSALKDLLFVLGTALIFVGLVSFNVDSNSLRDTIKQK